MLAYDYPFLDVFWTLLIIFAWVIWFWLLITVFADLFRRHDASGWRKAAWCLFVSVTPFRGVLVYLIANGHGMSERNMQRATAQQAGMDRYVRSVAASNGDGGGGAAAEIERAKALLDSGAITQAEFDAIKQKALA